MGELAVAALGEVDHVNDSDLGVGMVRECVLERRPPRFGVRERDEQVHTREYGEQSLECERRHWAGLVYGLQRHPAKRNTSAG
ncbi:hypothetical protein SAMN05443661_12530 [Natronobacterium gregoryi]|nr:hypothetical protein Natgr_2123 [Natronobacterium gregoryi SP2]SFJ37755.1 hypothetical protein SAMN05443661_12530 [Natronobacterium gregoryi]